MNTHSPEEIRTAIDSLPTSTRNFVESEDFKKIIYEMGTRFTLNLQGIAELTDTVTMTVLGLEPQESFPQRIAEVHTPLDAKGRSALIAEIDKKIFIEIKNRLHGPNEKSESL